MEGNDRQKIDVFKNNKLLLGGSIAAIIALIIIVAVLLPRTEERSDGKSDIEGNGNMDTVETPSESGENDVGTGQQGNEDIMLLKEFVSPFDSHNISAEFMAEMDGADYVLLGESSHGTVEYYRIRADITKKLIADKGFSFVAVEGDWPNIYHVNRYVKGYGGDAAGSGKDVLLDAVRWPEWMWANSEFLELVEWLRDYNKGLPKEEKVGLYGVDMQDMSASISKSVTALKDIDAELANVVAKEYDELEPLADDFIKYAQAYAHGDANSEREVRRALIAFNDRFERVSVFASPQLFNIKQNMLAVQYGETYSRAMVAGGSLSWNVRCNYMKRTVMNLGEHYGSGSKGIVWAHNTHVGDARATSMIDDGRVNIGQLLREEFGEDKVYLVGLGSYRGEVKAGLEWGIQGEVMGLPPAIPGSAEYMLAKADKPSFLILFSREEEIPGFLTEPIGHRAKGVVYNPLNDEGYYVPTIMSLRYDAFIFIEETTALRYLQGG